MYEKYRWQARFCDWMAFSHIINTFPYRPTHTDKSHTFLQFINVFHIRIRIQCERMGKKKATEITNLRHQKKKTHTQSKKFEQSVFWHRQFWFHSLLFAIAAAATEWLRVLAFFSSCLLCVYCFHFSIDIVIGLKEKIAPHSKSQRKKRKQIEMIFFFPFFTQIGNVVMFVVKSSKPRHNNIISTFMYDNFAHQENIVRVSKSVCRVYTVDLESKSGDEQSAKQHFGLGER